MWPATDWANRACSSARSVQAFSADRPSVVRGPAKSGAAGVVTGLIEVGRPRAGDPDLRAGLASLRCKRSACTVERWMVMRSGA